MRVNTSYDTIIIGGGFFGLSIANYIRDNCRQKSVLVLEKETDFMQRASYNNQARVHGGYHYPRSLLTGLRSQVNFDRFVKEHQSAIVDDFEKYYAVANNFSKVSARQFKLFCERIGAQINAAPKQIKQLFDPKLVEDVFSVREYAFDAKKLKNHLIKKLNKKVDLKSGVRVNQIVKSGDEILVQTESGRTFKAKKVINSTYSMINSLNKNSDLPIIPLKHELAEMSLIKMPNQLKNVYVTLMCGPFFSLMPFPDRGLATMSHVRYTPHSEWHDTNGRYRNGHDYLDKRVKKISHFPQMSKDIARFIPIMRQAEYVDSLWEIKTVLPQSEHDDSRPILVRRDHGMAGYSCIMGGKLDNIYDAFKELDIIYGQA